MRSTTSIVQNLIIYYHNPHSQDKKEQIGHIQMLDHLPVDGAKATHDEVENAKAAKTDRMVEKRNIFSLDTMSK